MLFERKTGFSLLLEVCGGLPDPNNNGHIGWLSSMQKLGLDGLFAAMNLFLLK